MKYNAPFGSSDSNASYVDRNTPGAQSGSRVPAAAIENPQRELAALIAKSGITPSDADLVQLSKAVRSQILNYRAAGGTANALTITLDPVPASYTELVGAPIRVKIASANTGAATLNVNGLGAKSIVRLGSGAAVGAGDLAAGAIYVLIYDGTSFQVSGAGGVALQTGGSTAAAPKLLNVDASTTTTFSVPTSTDTLLQYQTTNNLNLGTTTWNGGRLTIGAAEAGLWYIQASWVFTASAPSNFSTARLRKNGSAIVSEAAPATQPSGGGAVLQTISTLKLAAGDYIEALGNHQAGSTQTALADQRARFVAMLLSSY